MLRSQLSILVSTLPPFAVAKLNGDQLDELNISTKILVDVPDRPGTGQVDDYTWRKQRMAQQATTAASRPLATPAVRPNYVPGQTNPATYNSQVRNYNASVPATAAYGMRAPPNYQTPTASRPPYSPAPYPNAYPSSRPTVQQFQRPLQNGYANYAGAATPGQSPGYAQRATQPGFQQRAPEPAGLATAGRSASPQKPVLNGQTYPPRQQQYPPQSPQTPFPYQRQGSGTPGTPTAAAASVATPRAQPNGTPDRSTAAAGGAGYSVPTAPPAQSQTPASSTVEVSR